MKVLILNDHNGHESKDPQAWLIEVSDSVNLDTVHDMEMTQAGVGRVGGHWKQAFDDAATTYRIISEGKRSHYKRDQYNVSYKVTSGNY